VVKTRETTPTAVSVVVGRQVKALRERLGISQGQLALRLEKFGYPMRQVTIARLETGERRVTIDDVLAIAAALGVSPMYLLSAEFTNETMPVTPKITAGPSQMRFWLRGELPLPDTDELSFFELVPDAERLARHRRGIQHLRQCFRDFQEAWLAGDLGAQKIAVDDMRRELERQQADIEREEKRSRTPRHGRGR
jgi:transcriptional regulator with XRE-family HTH domain